VKRVKTDFIDERSAGMNFALIETTDLDSTEERP
jgi:hypothetical protein